MSIHWPVCSSLRSLRLSGKISRSRLSIREPVLLQVFSRLLDDEMCLSGLSISPTFPSTFSGYLAGEIVRFDAVVFQVV